ELTAQSEAEFPLCPQRSKKKQVTRERGPFKGFEEWNREKRNKGQVRAADLKEGPSVTFSKDKPETRESQPEPSLWINLDLSQGQRSQPLFLPHSPSSPGSLADLSESSAGLPVTTNLVKSSSTDLEPRESSSLRSKPLLSLVKSLSTEISRRVEPEVNLSKSDSKLHLHPFKQLTYPKILEARPETGGMDENDAWVSPPSMGSMSPTEPRGSSLIAELEDTRRKFSEAMQDQLSMLSKIMGDESSGSPKQGRTSGAGESPASHSTGGRDGSSDEGGLRCRRRTDGEHKGVCDTAVRRLQKDSLMKSSISPERHTHSRDKHLEICTYGDMIQVVERQNSSRETHPRTYPQCQVTVPGSSLPLHWLFPVGLLAYGFFVLPLPPYVTGLSVGIACGFMLGLVLVFMFAPQRSVAKRNWVLHSKLSAMSDNPLDGELANLHNLQGWMNETHSYDPETFHPSITHSVYVTLEGSRLQLAYPRANIARWASFDETPHKAVFLHSRTYQLANCKVSLVPPGLARKRVWNRKYPICITLAEGEEGEESVVEGQETEEERAEKNTDPHQQFPVTLYLFGRTGREKEEWFQHFVSNESKNPIGLQLLHDSANGLRKLQSHPQPLGNVYFVSQSYLVILLLNNVCANIYVSFLKKYFLQIDAKEHGSGGQGGVEAGAGSGPGEFSAESEPTWVNCLVGRIFWDFLREKYWADQVAHKIQKKLSKIKLPYFMNELTLADLDMGTCLPHILSTSKPTLDSRGLWLQLELVYTGCLQMTLETKMNLCKLGKEGEDEMKLCILADSDEESSSAGSSDEEEVPPSEHTGGRTSRKILRFVDKIAKSKYFQKATENEYIRKKISEVSNMPLMLSVEVLELSGTLAINIPPPPTDRIWYSFRLPPRLDLHVRPMLGEREVTFTHVTEWIEKKLQCEFQVSPSVFPFAHRDDSD
uniref:SMP-LTD domain-containing protein n=1 Tax=Oreochromis aureus TaxID=47969 RepID=A0AAZ1XQ95_OREAU